jgi:hypothetical protein
MPPLRLTTLPLDHRFRTKKQASAAGGGGSPSFGAISGGAAAGSAGGVGGGGTLSQVSSASVVAAGIGAENNLFPYRDPRDGRPTEAYPVAGLVKVSKVCRLYLPGSTERMSTF